MWLYIFLGLIFLVLCLGWVWVWWQSRRDRQAYYDLIDTLRAKNQAWDTLRQIYGETLNQEGLDLMESIRQGILADEHEEAIQKRGKGDG